MGKISPLLTLLLKGIVIRLFLPNILTNNNNRHEKESQFYTQSAEII